LDYTPSLDAYNAVIWGCVRMRLVDDAMQVSRDLHLK
jgi:pentatricopeptide repeat protein